MKLLNIKNSWFSESDLRLDASFHLSDGPITKRILESSPYKLTTLAKESSKIYSGNIFKRTFVNNAEKGYPYLTASTMTNFDIDSGKYISKKFTEKAENLRIKKDWILLSCSGTLGNVVFTNKIFEERIGTHDLIRIVPNENTTRKGFLYAFLASKYGYGLLTQSSYGGVIKHIEPHHLQDLPIPIFAEAKQIEIDDCITKASVLRDEANDLLKNAVYLLEKKLPDINFKTIYISKISQRVMHSSRLEATYDANLLDEFKTAILNSGAKLETIASLSEKVFTPGIFKRVRTNNATYGIPYLSGSSLLDKMPKFDSFLSKKMKNINDYILKEGWLAIQDAGTIGYHSLISKFLDGVSATNNLVRIKPKQNNSNFYIYGFFKTKIGQRLLKNLEYGSVQKHIDHHQISSFEIPIFESVYKDVSEKIEMMLSKSSDACFLEKKAIGLIENEIESWQKL